MLDAMIHYVTSGMLDRSNPSSEACSRFATVGTISLAVYEPIVAARGGRREPGDIAPPYRLPTAAEVFRSHDCSVSARECT